MRRTMIYSLSARAVTLMAALGLAGPLSAQTAQLQATLSGAVGSVLELDGNTTYLGTGTINRDITIEGNNALLDLSVTDASFKVFRIGNGATVTVRNVRIRGGNLGADVSTGGHLVLENSTISNCAQGVAHRGGGSLTVRNTTILDATQQGVNLGYVEADGRVTAVLDNVTILRAHQAVQGRNAELTMTNSLIDSRAVNGVDVFRSAGVGLQGGSNLILRNTRIVRHQNSVDLRESEALVEDCILDHPAISGVIALSNTNVTVRRTQFLANGQDGIYTDEVGANVGKPSNGVMEDCLIVDAGSEPAGPLWGIPERVGTGISLGSGVWNVHRCTVLRSYDVGVTTNSGARATITESRFEGNRLSGMAHRSTGQVVVRDCTFNGHRGESQAGLVLDSEHPLDITLDRVLIADNTFGVISRSAGNTVRFRDCLIADNTTQGFSVLHRGPLVDGREGALETNRTSIIQNGDYQVFVQSQGQSAFRNGAIWGNNGLGLYTERGTCQAASGLPTIATGNYWGNTSGPLSGCLTEPLNGRVYFRNANLEPILGAPAYHLYYRDERTPSRALVFGQVNGRDWLTVTGLSGDAFLGAHRYTTPFTAALPTDALGNEGIILWSSHSMATSGAAMSLRFEVAAAPGNLVFSRIDPTNASVMENLPVIHNADHLLVSARGSDLHEGVWVFRPGTPPTATPAPTPTTTPSVTATATPTPTSTPISTATPTPPPGDDVWEGSNNSRGGATLIPTNTWIEPLVLLNTDWYKFQFASCTSVKVTMEFVHAQGNLQMQLFDARCNTADGKGFLRGASYSGNNSEVIYYVNNTGSTELFLEVYGQNGATNPNYRLRIDELPIDDNFEPNNGPHQVLDFAFGGRVDNLICREDDWFLVNLPAGTNTIDVLARFQTQSGDLHLQVFDTNTNDWSGIIGNSFNTRGDQDFEWIQSLNVAGHSSVRVRVFGNRLNTNVYSLQVGPGGTLNP